MAQGYLGKISALVTVNTSDIASKVQSGFAEPFDKALRSIETTLRNTNRSVEQSFNNIYTASQKQARAIAAAQMGAVKNFNSEEFSKRLTVSNDIAAPISLLAKEIEKTSGAIRSQFEPALVEAQAVAQALFDDLAKNAPVSAERIGAVVSQVQSLASAFQSASTVAERMADGWKAMDAAGRKAGEKSRINSMFSSLGANSRRAVEDVDTRAAEAARAKMNAGMVAMASGDVGEKVRINSMFSNLGASSRRAVENLSVNRQAEEQERRIWAIRDAAQTEFEQRQLAASRSIQEEERAAIAAENAAREEGLRQSQEAAQAELRARDAIRERIQQEFQERQRLTAQLINDEERAAIAREREEREAATRQQEMLDENAARARDAAERMQQADAAAERAAAARLAGGVAAARTRTTDEFRESFGGRGAAGVNLGLDRNALAASTAQLQVIQRAIGRASAEARGPAVEAFVRLRNAIADAFEAGTIDRTDVRRNIAALQGEAVRAAAQAGGGNRRTLQRDVERAGDIARGGLDRFSLAIQQAGFALDDFFSSTGGLDMRIRAVSNNISQMAFILGGTAGLFTGLAFTIGSQVVVAMMKWADAGRTSEDRTKALNDAISKQQSLISGLSDAYRELAKSMNSAASPEAQKQGDRERMFRDVAAKRKQSMEESIYANDTGVASARASVAMEEKRAMLSVTTAQMQTAQMRISLAKRQEEAAKREALAGTDRFNAFVGNGAGAGSSVQAGIQSAIKRFGEIRMSGMGEDERFQFQKFIEAQMAAVPAAGDREGAAAQLRAFIEKELETNEVARDPGLVAASVLGDLFQQLARLEFGLKQTNAVVIDDVNKSLAGTSDVIESAKKSIDSAAMRTQDINSLQTEIDRVSASLEALSMAASETTDKGVLDAIAEDAKAAQELADRLNAAAAKAKEFADELAKAIAEENAAAGRGVDLGRVRDGMERVNDVRAAAANIAGDGNRRDFVNRAFKNIMADTASVMIGLQQERANAILGGPSRQALNSTDVSSVEGQREVNRLLRGDDASRDVNFAEMQKQTDLLSQIAEGIKAATGIVVDFR